MKSNLLKDILVCLLLLLICLPAVKDLFIPGGFTSHDLNHHVIRQISMNKLLSEGQFPPRWSGEINHEYGYPVFLFNYPLPPLIGEIIHQLGFGFVDSVKGVFLISILISGVGMYLFLKSLFNNRLAAVLGAIFWIYAPVRFLNVYVAAALGNALACGIIPYLFWCTTEVIKTGKTKWVIWGGMFLSLLIMTHNVSVVMFIPVLALFVILNLFQNLNNQRSRIKFGMTIVYMFLIGFGISAWFWIPSLWDKQYIRYDQFMAGFYQERFIDFYSLIRSKWGYGSDFSNQIGLVHLGMMGGLIGIMVWFRKVREVRWMGGFILSIFILSIFLTQKISLPLWDNLPLLSYIQFPNRWLTVTVFAACIATALVIKYLPHQKILVVSLIILVIYANRNHWHINQSTNHSEDYYRNLKTTATAYDEHLPIWAKPMTVDPISKVQSEKGAVGIITNHSNLIKAQITTDQATPVKINQYYFPGWKVLVDGKQVEVNYLQPGEDHGLMMINLPSGKHLVEAKFSETWPRMIADGISGLSLLLISGLFLRSLTRKLN